MIFIVFNIHLMWVCASFVLSCHRLIVTERFSLLKFQYMSFPTCTQLELFRCLQGWYFDAFCTIKVGLIQCLFTHSRSQAFLSCVSNAGNFSFWEHTAHVALIFLSVLRWAFLTLTTGSEMLMRMFLVKNYYELKEREILVINLPITYSSAFSITTF